MSDCKVMRVRVGYLLLSLGALGLFVAGASADQVIEKAKYYTNNSGAPATDFHVKAWQKEDNIDIVRSLAKITFTY